MLLLSLACVHTVTRPGCEVVSSEEIDDGEETWLGSPMQVLSALSFDGVAPVRWADGASDTAQIQVRRGVGPAVFTEEVFVDQVTEHRRVGRPTDFLVGGPTVICRDRLDVPLQLTVSAESSEMALSLQGGSVRYASFHDEPEQRAAGARALAVDDQVPVFEQDPLSLEQPELRLDLQLLDGAIAEGELSWTARESAEGDWVSETVLDILPSD